MREFSKWAGEEIESVCLRNDHPRPGKELKPSWETMAPELLYMKIHEEFAEMIEAYRNYIFHSSNKNREALQWELQDVAATCMMMLSKFDPIMRGLRRGRIRGREFPT